MTYPLLKITVIDSAPDRPTKTPLFRNDDAPANCYQSGRWVVEFASLSKSWCTINDVYGQNYTFSTKAFAEAWMRCRSKDTGLSLEFYRVREKQL